MTFPRRRFLKGLGGLTLGLPLLGALPTAGRAQGMPSPAKRAIFFWTPNGFNLSTVFPRARTAGGSAFGPLTAASFAPRPLDDASNDTVDGVPRRIFRHPEWALRNLQPYADRIAVLRGFRNSRRGFQNLADGGDHGMNTACRLTAAGIGGGRGLALGRSVDYAIAERINPLVDGNRLPLVLHVGRNADPRTSNGTSFISYRGSEDPDPGINNPWVAYRRLLGLTPGSPTEDYLVRRKRRTADFVRAELTTLKSSLPLGGRDRRLVDQWLGLIEDVEDDMSSSGAMCSATERDRILPPADADDWQNASNDALGRSEDAGAIGGAMLKIIALSMLCGHTNVATLQWSFGAGGPAFGALGMNAQDAGPGTWHGGERHHELSHRNGSDGAEAGFLPDVERNMSWIDQWYGDRFRDLVALLDGFSLLDDSVVVWLPEFGDGRQHHYYEIAAIVAGSAGGYLRTGAMIDCSSDGRWNDRLDTETNGPRIRAASNAANVYDLDVGAQTGTTSHNKLLTTVYNAVLPRDATGAPIDPLRRFPEVNTADALNLLEEGEVDAWRT